MPRLFMAPSTGSTTVKALAEARLLVSDASVLRFIHTTAKGQSMRISLIANLNNQAPIESCVRDLAQARDEGFA